MDGLLPVKRHRVRTVLWTVLQNKAQRVQGSSQRPLHLRSQKSGTSFTSGTYSRKQSATMAGSRGQYYVLKSLVSQHEVACMSSGSGGPHQHRFVPLLSWPQHLLAAKSTLTCRCFTSLTRMSARCTPLLSAVLQAQRVTCVHVQALCCLQQGCPRRERCRRER
jgi:hypothetical protein